ncbi:AAA family ATPase [Streptomyces sp. NPDC047841]|uniref:helix-turn-helix transcriptional regulator n=1 Tax=Streptomyces sp. NPDC047841 TaxID=3154708 RepID=UPI0034529768
MDINGGLSLPDRIVRTSEFARLTDFIQLVRTRGHGGVEVLGDPGSGKTWLLDAAARDARRRGMWVLRARCSMAEAEVPLHPFLQALNAWVASADGAPGGDAKRTERARALARTLAQSAGSLQPMPSWDRFFEQRRALAECLALAPAGCLLVLDDMQWADAWSIRFLEILIRWPVEERLALVVAHRPRQSPVGLRAALQEGIDLGFIGQVHLDPLTVSQSGALLDVDPASPDLARLHQEGDGLPLYVTALAGKESPRLDNAETWAQSPLGARLLTEVSRLDSEARLVAHVAAVLGDSFDVPAVAATAQMKVSSASRALSELRRHDVVRMLGAGTMMFRHPLMRYCIYGCTSTWWRHDLHRRALEYLTERGEPATVLALHIEAIGAEDPAAVRTLVAAASAALHSGRSELAVRWLVGALRAQRARGGGARHGMVDAAVWRRVAQAAAADGDRERLIELGGELLSLLDESTGARATAAATLACLHASLGDAERGQALLGQETARLGRADPAVRAVMDLSGVLVKLLTGTVPSRAELDSLGSWARQAHPVHGFGAEAVRALCVMFEGDRAEGQRLLAGCAQALANCSDGDAETPGFAEFLLMMAWAEALVGEYESAQRHVRAAHESMHKTGGRHQLPLLLLVLTGIHYGQGELPEAYDAAKRAEAAARQIGRHDYAAVADAFAAAAAGRAWHRHPAPSAPRFRHGLDEGNFWAPVAVILQAEASLSVGDNVGVLELLAAQQDMWESAGPAKVHRARVYELLAAAAEGLGDKATAGHWESLAAKAVRSRPGRREASDGTGTAPARTDAAAAEERSEPAQDEGDAPGGSAPGRTAEESPLPTALLTTRERQVAQLVGEGMRTKDIATSLGVSPRTVDTHLARIYSKMGVHSRAELMRKVFLEGDGESAARSLAPRRS